MKTITKALLGVLVVVAMLALSSVLLPATSVSHMLSQLPFVPTAFSRLPLVIRHATFIHTPTPPATSTPEPTQFYTYHVVNEYPHDPDAFTQGLIYQDGVMYEGTGRWGHSSLRRVDLETGDVLQRYDLSDEYFGEGVTLFGNRLIQLTWKSRIGFVYDKDSFALLRDFDYLTEGWGITHDGQRLIMSDGSSTLYFWNPETFEEIGRVEVFDDDGPVVRLNELEYIHGEVYANVWQTDQIARIDPETGRVTGWIDLTGLLSPEDRRGADVLNGIAYDAGNDRLFVTGKLWPKLFQIELVPR